MNATLVHHHQRTLEQKIDPSPLAEMRRAYHRYCWEDDFAKNGRTLFAKHNAAVRAVGQGRRFLELEAAGGWQPLCEFLGVPVPDIAFPRKDDWLDYKSATQAADATRG